MLIDAHCLTFNLCEVQLKSISSRLFQDNSAIDHNLSFFLHEILKSLLFHEFLSFSTRFRDWLIDHFYDFQLARLSSVLSSSQLSYLDSNTLFSLNFSSSIWLFFVVSFWAEQFQNFKLSNSAFIPDSSTFELMLRIFVYWLFFLISILKYQYHADVFRLTFQVCSNHDLGQLFPRDSITIIIIILSAFLFPPRHKLRATFDKKR